MSAHAGWAGRWCGWCACVPLVGRIVVAWLSFVFVSAPLFASVVELVDTPHSKCGARVSVWVRVPPEVLAARDNAGWRLRCQSDEIGRHSALKMRRPVGRAGSSPATGTRGSKISECGGCVLCAFLPTLGRVA